MFGQCAAAVSMCAWCTLCACVYVCMYQCMCVVDVALPENIQDCNQNIYYMRVPTHSGARV